MPEGFGYLLAYYYEVRGEEALTFTEIRNWSEMTARFISPSEAVILKEVDSIRNRLVNQHQSEKLKSNGHLTSNHKGGNSRRKRGK